jgi:hypothetical protein
MSKRTLLQMKQTFLLNLYTWIRMRIQQLKLMRIRIRNPERNLVTRCYINSDPLLQEVLQEVPLPALPGRGYAAGTGGRLPQEPITVAAHHFCLRRPYIAERCLDQDPDPDWIRIQLGIWIRIQEGNNVNHQKSEEILFLKCWMFPF